MKDFDNKIRNIFKIKDEVWRRDNPPNRIVVQLTRWDLSVVGNLFRDYIEFLDKHDGVFTFRQIRHLQININNLRRYSNIPTDFDKEYFLIITRNIRDNSEPLSFHISLSKHLYVPLYEITANDFWEICLVKDEILTDE